MLKTLAHNHFLIVTSFTFLTYSLSCANKPLQQGFAEDDTSAAEIIQERYEPIDQNQKSTAHSGTEASLLKTIVVKPVLRDVASIAAASFQDPQACLRFQLPSQFTIRGAQEGRRRFLQVLDSSNKVFAEIEQSVLNAGQFEVLDLQKRVVLTGVENKSTAASQIELFDCKGEKIGRIQQDFEKSFVSASLSYSWLDSNDQFLSVVEKANELSPEVVVIDRQDKKWASLFVEKKTQKFQAATQSQMTRQQAYLLLATLKLFTDGRTEK